MFRDFANIWHENDQSTSDIPRWELAWCSTRMQGRRKEQKPSTRMEANAFTGRGRHYLVEKPLFDATTTRLSVCINERPNARLASTDVPG
jgi:hypothetical protein